MVYKLEYNNEEFHWEFPTRGYVECEYITIDYDVMKLIQQYTIDERTKYWIDTVLDTNTSYKYIPQMETRLSRMRDIWHDFRCGILIGDVIPFKLLEFHVDAKDNKNGYTSVKWRGVYTRSALRFSSSSPMMLKEYEHSENIIYDNPSLIDGTTYNFNL